MSDSPSIGDALGPGDPVFVTGGSGLVGSHVAELLRAQGHPVRALHRPGSDVAHLLSLGCELEEGTLDDPAEAFARRIEGCGAVVHAAAVTYSGLPWPRVHEINVRGTVNVLQGAARASVRRVVHMSSVAAYGDPGGLMDEGHPSDSRLRAREHYARSKRDGERAAEESLRNTGVTLVILRPSSVYGERDRLFTPKLARAFRLPLHPVLGRGETPLPAVYAGNLAHAAAAALRGVLPERVRHYNVAGDHPVTQIDFYEALALASGRRFRPVRIPAPLVAAVARTVEALRLPVPGAGEVPLRRAAWLAVTPNPYSSRRIRDELEWAPRVSLDKALRRTAGWAAQAGLV